MQDSKNKVVKSKSSNSAITRKSPTRKNKKSLSNAEIKPLTLKKRGVYVEKNPTTSNTERSKSPLPECKSPKSSKNLSSCPRPDKSRFLASVLTILSKSTTGTQFPDHSNIEKFKKKSRYRSKYLNEETNSEYAQLVILQSTKEIVQTPSINSERTNMADSNAAILTNSTKWVDANDGIGILKSEKQDDIKKNSEKKVTIVEEYPTTAVITEQSGKDDKNMYNFFVDLLETTINEYQGEKPSDHSLKNILEIDEVVANKLAIKRTKAPHRNYETPVKYSSNFCCVEQNENESFLKPKTQPTYYKQPIIKPLYKRKKPAKNIIRNNYPPIIFNERQRKTGLTKRIAKKLFINSLKEELQMDDYYYEEPQNLFQALKVMARNKRRCQKVTNIDEPVKPNSEVDTHVCHFRRRHILLPRNRKPKKTGDNRKWFPHAKQPPKKNSTITVSPKMSIAQVNDESSHSIKVRGYRYETMPSFGNLKIAISSSTYHSTSTTSQSVAVDECTYHCDDNVEY